MDINELITIVKKKLLNQINIENINIEDKSFLNKNYKGNQEGKYHLKLIIFYLISLSSIYASELSQEELNYFNIMDLNNDGYVSPDKINQSINIIFQLIDTNNDKKISLEELKELKEIVNILK